MVRKQRFTSEKKSGHELTVLVGLVSDIDQKLSYLIEQLRKDLYILVPREGDILLGGPHRRKRPR